MACICVFDSASGERRRVLRSDELNYYCALDNGGSLMAAQGDLVYVPMVDVSRGLVVKVFDFIECRLAKIVDVNEEQHRTDLLGVAVRDTRLFVITYEHDPLRETRSRKGECIKILSLPEGHLLQTIHFSPRLHNHFSQIYMDEIYMDGDYLWCLGPGHRLRLYAPCA